MTQLRHRRSSRRLAATLLLLAGAGATALVSAQETRRQPRSANDTGAPRSGSFEVGGVDVDVRGPNAEAARLGGWREAQRKGWQLLAQRLTGRSSSLNDGALNSLVTGIVVERELIGPNRYVARLGVQFDRARAASILGVSGQFARSAPMLLVPLEWSAGTGRVFETSTDWKEAWQRFRAGNSAIDYVRPGGSGADSLLLNAGQVGRRGRGWWRAILDQYGAADILVPEVRIHHSYPGGPVTGVFTAFHGPDNNVIARFTLRVANGDGLPALLDEGIRRIDAAYQDALRAGRLERDSLLAWRAPRAATEAEAAGDDAAAALDAPAAGGSTISIQFDTPGVAAVTATEAVVRGIPGVTGAATSSLALGGVSVMRVTYQGDLAGLRAALAQRGYSVDEGPGVLRIRRGGGQSAPAPQPGNDSEG